MDLGQRFFLFEAPQERLRSATILSWLEAHARKGATPSLYFGQLSFRVRCQTRFGNFAETGDLAVDGSILCDALRKEHARNKLWIVSPNLLRMTKMHSITPHPELVLT